MLPKTDQKSTNELYKTTSFSDLVFLTSWTEFGTPEPPKQQCRAGETLVFKNHAICMCSPFGLKLGPHPGPQTNQNGSKTIPEISPKIDSKNDAKMDPKRTPKESFYWPPLEARFRHVYSQNLTFTKQK